MAGLKNKIFKGINHREYKVIEKHSVFNNVWRCYPIYSKIPLNAPIKKVVYYQANIKLFSEDYIKENLVD